MKLLANDQTHQHDASLLCLSSCPVQNVLLPFLLSGVSAGHLTVALTAGLQDNKHMWVQKLKVKNNLKKSFCLLVYLNLLVGLGEELGVTPLSCDWNHWRRRRKWNTEYTNRLNPQSVNESDLDQSEPSIQSLNPLIWILVERTSVFLLIHSLSLI